MPTPLIPPIAWVRHTEPGGSAYVIKGDTARLATIVQGTRKWLTFSHPRVVALRTIEELDPDTLRITTADDTGTSLLDHVQRWPYPGDRAAWVIPQLCGLCDALTAMAERMPGFAHRRVCPATLFVDDTGTLRLRAPIDQVHVGGFRMIEQPDDRESCAWMSPEGLRGMVCTPRSDVFELALLLYTAIAGHRPFKRSHDSLFETMHQIIVGPEPEPPPTPAPLAAVIVKNLSRTERDRDESPAAFAAALRACT